MVGGVGGGWVGRWEREMERIGGRKGESWVDSIKKNEIGNEAKVSR